jgi:hypothetical protein
MFGLGLAQIAELNADGLADDVGHRCPINDPTVRRLTAPRTSLSTTGCLASFPKIDESAVVIRALRPAVVFPVCLCTCLAYHFVVFTRELYALDSPIGKKYE